MAFKQIVSASPKHGNGSGVTPLSTLARPSVAVNDLKAAAATLAQLRNPMGTDFDGVNLIDITGATRLRLIPRLSDVANIVWSQDARVMVFAGIGEWTSDPATNRVSLVNVQSLERIDGADGDGRDGSYLVNALAATSGVAVGVPASPSTSNMLKLGNFLFRPALRFTDENGSARPYLDVASYNFAFVLPVQAATGTKVTGETAELIAIACN